jgi:hypothetical protein
MGQYSSKQTQTMDKQTALQMAAKQLEQQKNAAKNKKNEELEQAIAGYAQGKGNNQDNSTFEEMTKHGWQYADNGGGNNNGNIIILKGDFNLQGVKENEYNVKRYWEMQLEDGATMTGEPTTYTKTYTFYSSSAIREDQYDAKGYQDLFTWRNHEFIYAHKETQYSTTLTYTYIGTDSHTHYVTTYQRKGGGNRLVGTFTEGPTVENNYEWRTTEHSPTVNFVYMGHELYVPYASMGIVAERDKLLTEGNEVYMRTLSDEHSIETAFTDNKQLSFALDDEYDQIATSIDSVEQEFWYDLFGGSDLGIAELLDMKFEELALQMYNSSILSRDLYPITMPPNITSNELTEVPSLEQQASADLTITEGETYST